MFYISATSLTAVVPISPGAVVTATDQTIGTFAVIVTVTLTLCTEAQDPVATALVITSRLPGRVLPMTVAHTNCC